MASRQNIGNTFQCVDLNITNWVNETILLDLLVRVLETFNH